MTSAAHMPDPISFDPIAVTATPPNRGENGESSFIFSDWPRVDSTRIVGEARPEALPRRETRRRWSLRSDQHKPLDQHCLTLLHGLPAERRSGLGCAVGFTGCRRGEGVSSIAANVAVCAARVNGKPVLLIDAHVDHPAVASRFRLSRSPGWSDAVSGRVDLPECLQRTPIQNLWAIVARKDRHASTQTYNTRVTSRLIAEFKSRFDLIVVDLPPASEQNDCLALSAALDGVVMVVGSEKVRAQAARRVREHFDRAGIHLLGAVLNKRRDYVPNWLYRRL
jgi:protein-tyrosine kinase